MNIITGFTNEEHIIPEYDRDINIGFSGADSYVLNNGMKLAAEISSNNEIKIRDGLLIHQGCAASITKNTYDSIQIANGSQGMQRIDLIVARYKKNENSKVESLELLALQGTPAEANPTAPEYIIGDIQAGDVVADMPLYEVHLEGLNIVEIVPLFNVLMPMSEQQAMLTELNKKCNQVQNGIESFQVAANGIATKTVTFITAFDDVPVISTAFSTPQLGSDKMCITSITNDRVVFSVYTTASAHTVNIYWRAEPQK